MNRTEQLKIYLMNVLDGMRKDFEMLNVNFLSSDIDNYSLDKIPTQSVIETTITGKQKKKDVYNLRSRNAYGSNEATNLSNIGFWETFERIIYSNNEQGILPNIDGIYEIKCLNCGSLQRADTQTCEMSIQIEIDYLSNNEEISL